MIKFAAICHKIPLILVLPPNNHMLAVHPYLKCLSSQIQSNKGNPPPIGPRYRAVEQIQPIWGGNKTFHMTKVEEYYESSYVKARYLMFNVLANIEKAEK